MTDCHAATVYICTASLSEMSTVTVLGDHNDTTNNNDSAYSPFPNVSVSFSGCGTNSRNVKLSD